MVIMLTCLYGLKNGNIEYEKIDDLQDGLRDLITKAQDQVSRRSGYNDFKWY